MFGIVLLAVEPANQVIGYAALVIIIIFIAVYFLNFRGHKNSLKNFKVPEQISKNGLLIPNLGIDRAPFGYERIDRFFAKLVLFEDRVEYKSWLNNFSLSFSKIKQIDYQKLPLVLGVIDIDDSIRVSVGDEAASKEILSFFKRKGLPFSKKALEFLDSKK